MSLERNPITCVCGRPDKEHAAGPFQHNRSMPVEFGPAYREENMHYRKLQLHAEPELVRGKSYDLLSQDTRPDLQRVHKYCNKTCALYYTFPRPVSGKMRDARYQLNDQAYGAWFHHGQSSYRHGNFLYKEIDVAEYYGLRAQASDEEGPKTEQRLRKLIEGHAQLCAVLENRLENITLDDKSRDPETDEELIDWETETDDHYIYRHEFELRSSFKRLFLMIDGPFADLVLVVLGKREGEGWSVVETPDSDVQTFSWMKASAGKVFEVLLRETGLPSSSHPEIMRNGFASNLRYSLE